MRVTVDRSWQHRCARQFDLALATILADAGNPAIADSEIRLGEVTGVDIEPPTWAQGHVGGLLAQSWLLLIHD